MDLARRALSHWNIDEPTLTEVARGPNDVFKVEPGPFTLRIQPRSTFSDDVARSQLAWLHALDEESPVVVPAPVPLPDGEPFLVLENHRCLLLRWIEGESLRVLPPVEAARLVGRTIGRLHAHARAWSAPAGFTCPTHEVRLPARDLLGLSPAEHDLLARARDRVRACQEEIGRTRDTHGVVHGDTSFQNFVLHEGEACPIDFDEFGHGYFLSDVAEPLRVITHYSDYHELRAALLDAYRQEQRLSESDEERLDLFIVGNILSVMSWACRPEAASRRDEITPWIPAWLDEIARLAGLAPSPGA